MQALFPLGRSGVERKGGTWHRVPRRNNHRANRLGRRPSARKKSPVRGERTGL